MNEDRPQTPCAAARLPQLAPRLVAAKEMLLHARCVADIGCDHALLSCALLRAEPRMRCIATDVSSASLRKAQAQALRFGVSDRLSLRHGDGLSVLETGEADAIALLGMGGTLIARLLDAVPTPLAGARLGVFQPMRGVSDLRRYLWTHGYHVQTDRIVREGGRLYQILSVLPPTDGIRQSLPENWPPDCFELGYTSFIEREEAFLPLCEQLLAQCEKRLLSARGTAGEAHLCKRASELRAILAAYENA